MTEPVSPISVLSCSVTHHLACGTRQEPLTGSDSEASTIHRGDLGWKLLLLLPTGHPLPQPPPHMLLITICKSTEEKKTDVSSC